MELTLSLLGETEVQLDGKLLEDLSAEKACALLFFLVVESHHSHRRDALAEMFWPEKPPGYGRNNLKQTLSLLRNALGDRDLEEPFLLTSNRDLQFNSGRPHQVDVQEFENLSRKVKSHPHPGSIICEGCADLLNRAVNLYRDDFLSDFYLADSPEFNEWTLSKRESYKRMMADSLSKLISFYEEKGNFKTGAEYGKNLVNLEPWSESNHRRLMALLAASGKRSAALKQYHACEAMLASEFNVEPTQDTISLYEKIKKFKPEDGNQDSFLKYPEELSTVKQITAKVQRETSHLKYWVIGSLLISLLMLIWFGYTNWVLVGDQPILGNSKTSSAENLPQTLPDIPASDQIQIRNQAAPEVQSYLQGVNPNYALAAIYSQTGGSTWIQNDGWLEEKSPCTWYGITCQNNNIIGIRLSNNNLEGRLPPEMGDIATLIELDLSNNHLKGPIPDKIGLLVNLESLNLEGNFEISGEIPPEVGNLKNLEELILSSASAGGSLLSGELPTEIGGLIKLDKLIIEDTLIQGAIPHQLGNLSKLTVLSLSQNNLSGPIPDEIFDLRKLRSLDLWANQNLSSTLSPKIGQLTHLDFLNISGNQFSGNLPAELGSLINLDWIGFHDNPFEGALPLSLTELNPSVFQYENTNICEPADPIFQDWLVTISGLSRTGVTCDDNSTGHDDSTLTPTDNDPFVIPSKLACLPGEILIYQEDFQDNQIPEWPELYYLAQGWMIIPDPLMPDNKVVHHAGDQDATTILKSVDFENAVWRIWVKKIGQGTAFLFWNWTNPPDGSEVDFSAYQIEINFGGQNTSGNAIYRVNWPISHVTLANRQFQIEDNSWVLYEVINYQDQFEIRINQIPIFSYQDPYPLPIGKVGLDVWSTTDRDFEIYFDNVSICGLTAPGIFQK